MCQGLLGHSVHAKIDEKMFRNSQNHIWGKLTMEDGLGSRESSKHM